MKWMPKPLRDAYHAEKLSGGQLVGTIVLTSVLNYLFIPGSGNILFRRSRATGMVQTALSIGILAVVMMASKVLLACALEIDQFNPVVPPEVARASVWFLMATAVLIINTVWVVVVHYKRIKELRTQATPAPATPL